jgi:lysine-specific demethylase 8
VSTPKLPVTRAIDRVAHLSKEQFERDYLATNQPVVVTNALEGYPARSKWSFDWFRSNYGDREVLVIKSADKRSGYGQFEPIRLGAYLDQLIANPELPLYMSESRLLADAPELREDIPLPALAPTGVGMERRLWLGPAKSVTHFHKDNHFSFARIRSLFTQIEGRKRFVLVSPEQDHLMYEEPNQGTMTENGAYQSLVDCEFPDFENQPLFREAVLHETVVESGEMLFIPAGWWHYVRGITPCISVSNWWLEARIAEMVTQLTTCGDPEGFLAEHAGTLTDADVAVFHGGVSALAQAFSMLQPHEQQGVLALFEPSARAQVLNDPRWSTPT